MTDKIEEVTRKQVAEFLPRAIEKALGSYYNYLENPPEEEKPKGPKKQTETLKFKNYHLAGKVALSHINLLLGLARWADLPVGDSGMPVKDLSQIMTLARSESEANLAEFPDEEGDYDLA